MTPVLWHDWAPALLSSIGAADCTAAFVTAQGDAKHNDDGNS